MRLCNNIVDVLHDLSHVSAGHTITELYVDHDASQPVMALWESGLMQLSDELITTTRDTIREAR